MQNEYSFSSGSIHSRRPACTLFAGGSLLFEPLLRAFPQKFLFKTPVPQLPADQRMSQLPEKSGTASVTSATNAAVPAALTAASSVRISSGAAGA